jgi:hypothetical protein
MRLILAGAALGAMLVGTATLGAQAAATSVKFSGIKLVDMKARTPEQTVNVVMDSGGVKIVDPIGNKPIKSFEYAGLDVTHTVNSAPPAEAGSPSAASTGAMSMPMYMGRDPRNWLTLKSGTDLAVLRVSPHVFTKFKATLGEHNVKITEGK